MLTRANSHKKRRVIVKRLLSNHNKSCAQDQVEVASSKIKLDEVTLSKHKIVCDTEDEATFSHISKYGDAEDEVTSSERPSDINTEVDATSSKVTKHVHSEYEVPLSKQKSVCKTEVVATSSHISKYGDTEDEVTSSERPSDNNTEVDATYSKVFPWSKRVKKYGRHFSAPFPISIRNKYFHDDFAERSYGNSEIIPKYDPNSDKIVLLKVGMLLYTDFMQGVGCFKKHTIVEFHRGSITLAPLLVIPISEINLDSDMHIRYDHHQTGVNTRLNEEDSIFVIQNPAVTEILKNTRNDGIRDVYERNDANFSSFRKQI